MEKSIKEIKTTRDLWDMNSVRDYMMMAEATAEAWTQSIVDNPKPTPKTKVVLKRRKKNKAARKARKKNNK